VTEPTPLAPSRGEAAAATERLAAWVIAALTAIVIGGIAIVIYVPRALPIWLYVSVSGVLVHILLYHSGR
jgi:hypothetical protein